MLKDFKKFQAQTSPNPIALEIAKAEGVTIYDTKGKRYIDLTAGLAVNNIGFCNPEVVRAVKNQVDAYMHVMPYGEFIQSPQLELAKKLAAILPKSLSTTYFVNSGTEANEAALKLAKRYTGRIEIISFNNSYHGSTHGSLSVTGNENKKYAFRPLLPGVTFIDFNNIEQLSQITNKTAAVIIETIQGDAGVRIPSLEFMLELRQRCTQTQTLLILDEVQVGIGRTGLWFAFEHMGIVPDILTLGKALGGGMPIGAMVSSHEIMSVLSHDPMLGHITTFGGHPVSCAAGCATIDYILNSNIINEVAAKGELFKKLLVHPKIIQVRGIGLMLAVEMENFEQINKVITACHNKGVLGFWFISCNNSFRISPALTITTNEIKHCCKMILESIESL